MSSECLCHTDEFCFYCEMYSPLEKLCEVQQRYLAHKQEHIDSQAKEIERLSAIVTRYEDTLTEEGYDIRFMIAEVDAHLITLAEGRKKP